jgi:hypothetical protein
MDVGQDQIREVMRELGSRGGSARAKNLSAAERRRIAIKASKAAAEARKKKARERKRTQNV